MNDYNEMPDFDQGESGEVIRETDASSALSTIGGAQIDLQRRIAERQPRSIKRFIDRATEMVTLDEETAAECIYALPRDGKTIEGPSARFAEIIAHGWTNCRCGSRQVGEDDSVVRSEGLFFDVEANVIITFEVSRRITDKRGNKYKPDMISMTANAAGSIALRQAVLKGVPKAFWKKVYDRARAVVAGDFKTLANRRAEAMKQLAVFGVLPQMVFTLFDVKGIEDVTLEHMVTLRGILTAIKEGDTTPEQVFSQSPTQDQNLADKAGSKLASITERYSKKPEETNTKMEGAGVNPPQAPAVASEAPPEPMKQEASQQRQHTPRRSARPSPVEHGISGVFDK